MASKTRDFYTILLLVAVLYTSAYAEEETEDESLSTDRNSLSSLRLPSKFMIGKVSAAQAPVFGGSPKG
jgi:hypothetical protein